MDTKSLPNREIKFRYTVTRNNGYIFNHAFSLQQIENGEYETWMKVNNIWAHDIHRDQYTGLKDKAGREIYEGDIIKAIGVCSEPDIWKIIFHNGCFTLFNPKTSEAEYLNFYNTPLEVEVIGNLYENPELLK